MTREQVVTIFTDLGLEAPQKGVVNALLNAFNQEKSADIENAKKTATDEAAAKYKGYIKPEDHQKIVDELNAEKDKGALATRKEAYKKANLNIEDNDIFTLLETKFKDSKDLDKDLEAYAKEHPSFLNTKKEEEKKENPKPNPQPQPPVKITLGAGGNQPGAEKPSFDLGGAISEHYNNQNK